MTTALELVVIGGSAGSLRPLIELLKEIPNPFPVPVVMVIHLAKHTSALASVIAHESGHQTLEIEDKLPFLAGCVHVAPPDYHVLFESHGHFALSNEEPIAFSRPSIDVLFESAALTFGSHVVGILLSGANHDGAAGLKKIREAGGLALIQDPVTAEFDEMPRAAQTVTTGTKALTPKSLGQEVARLLNLSVVES